MFRYDAGADRPIEYSIMVEPRPAGPTIGVYGGLPICESVIDLFGRRFGYIGVACRRRDGQYEAASLKPGEFIIEPGLVYGLENGKPVFPDAAKADRSSSDRPPQSPTEAMRAPADAGEARRVLGEIAATLVLFLTGGLAIQLVLHAFGIG